MRFGTSLVFICLLTLVLLGAASLVYVKNRNAWKLNAALYFGIFWSLVVGVFLVDAILYWPDSNVRVQVQAVLACLAGTSLGWILGMWISPVGQTESTKFGKYWTAIGVGSGVTLKWAFDQMKAHSDYLLAHWFIAALFVTACVITIAAVYSSRAYEKCLEVHVRKDADYVAADMAGDTVKVNKDKTCTFYAQVSGPSDAMSRWEVLPATLGTIDANGRFKAASTGEGRVAAMNLEDPTLSGVINVKVV